MKLCAAPAEDDEQALAAVRATLLRQIAELIPWRRE